jgi:serine/threonine-protein kinase
MALSTGEIIDDKYRIVRLIGEGGMGAVYEGENMRIHRRVAIKVLHAGVAETAEAVQRFEREAQAAGRIGSEHIVEVLDLGNLASGDRYMVMEFMDGDSLSDRIRDRGRLNPAEIYPIAVQLLDALAAAHGAGIIHRDLKPDNVFLLRSRSGRADFVKLLDFGISKFNKLSGDSGMSMTRTGSVMGTPYYMAPEQAKGSRAVDYRVDIYATGVILYECITGQVPFNADTFNELLFKIVLEAPPPIEQLVPDVDTNFAAIINKAMARDPGHRFESAQDFRQALDQWVQGNPIVVPVVQAQSASSAPTGVAPTVHGTSAPTPGTWSQTGAYPADATPQRKSNKGLVIGIALLALLLVGGGGIALKMSNDAAARAEAAARVEDEKRKAEEERKKREEAERQKATEEAERIRAEAERAKQEAAAAAEEAKKLTSPKARAEAQKEADRKAQEAAAAEAKLRVARTRSTATQATKAAAPTKSAAPTETSGTTSGRKFRTEL